MATSLNERTICVPRLECDIRDWVKIVVPWKPKSFAAGDYIVDCDETLEGGWGPSACRLTDPNGGTLFGFWYDDEAIDSILLQHARRTLNPGDVFYYTDPEDKIKRQLRLRRYTSTGMFASEVNEVDLAELAGGRVTRGARKRKRDEKISATKRKLPCVKYSWFMFLLLLLVVGHCFYFFMCLQQGHKRRCSSLKRSGCKKPGRKRRKSGRHAMA